ncbi:MAG: glucose-1-phosphate thymidylyltransferase [Candidatus Daviesbacteria bacterium]|nr:glucose-1-phosphate thymidylyltransferase [Candidatus Daviesbacteria bacterium]
MKAIIPTGGRGTRMRPLTFSANKHFIPVANKPLIFYPIETIADCGIKEIAITYNSEGLTEAKSFLGDGSRWGLKFSYILQEQPLGLANIFQVCEEYLNGEEFVLHLGDNIFIDGIKNFVDHFLRERPNGLVPMVHHKENTRLGVPYFDKKGHLIKYVEKPENPPHDFAIPGLYFFDKEVFECFKGKESLKPSSRGEYEISAPFQWLIDHRFRVDVLEYKGVWLDPGKFDDWLEANKFILKTKLKETSESKIDSSSKISGKVSLGKNCTIVNSKINGPSAIGDNVKIIDSEIKSFTSISDNCEVVSSKVENSVLMSGVKIINVKKRPIYESLIGTDTEIIGKDGWGAKTSLFVGEKCKIQL